MCFAVAWLLTHVSCTHGLAAQGEFVPPALVDEMLHPLTGLDVEQVADLKESVPVLFALMMGDEQAAYDEQMKRWGGERAAPPPQDANSPNAWMDPNAPGRIGSCDPSTLELSFAEVIAPNGRDLRLSKPRKLDGAGMVSFSRYRFGVGQQALASQGSPVVHVALMTEQASGEPLWLELYVVWEPTTKGWVPWMVQQEVKPGKSIPSGYL